MVLDTIVLVPLVIMFVSPILKGDMSEISKNSKIPPTVTVNCVENSCGFGHPMVNCSCFRFEQHNDHNSLN